MQKIKQAIQVQKWVTIIGAALMAAKFIAYLLTHSVAILTDAMESIVNLLAGLISLYSLFVAARPRDQEHPYGHGKIEFLSAGVEGSLIILAGLLIIYESVVLLAKPMPIQKLDTGILIIIVSGIINLLAGLMAVKTGKNANSYAVTATGRHLVSDSITTAGLVTGLLVLYFTKVKWLDSIIAIAVAVIIIVTGAKILRTSIAGIMDEADKVLLQRMITLLNNNRRIAWIDMHNLRVIKFGSALHLDCHVTLPWYYNLHDAHAEIDELEKLIRNEFGTALELFVHTDGCEPFSCRICTLQQCNVRKHAFEKRVEWISENIFNNKKHELANA